MKSPAVLLVVLIGFAACRSSEHPQGPVKRAQFGVLYGGEIQERQHIPFDLDRTRLTLLLRLDFYRPLEREVRVSWRVGMPGTSKGVRDTRGRPGAGRLVRVNQVVVPVDRLRLDQVIRFEPGDPLGTWRICAQVDGVKVLDRSFVVHEQSRADGGLPDAASVPCPCNES
ncbi:hypothetical protein ACFL5O_05450 [Myxococcota bacterium]